MTCRRSSCGEDGCDFGVHAFIVKWCEAHLAAVRHMSTLRDLLDKSEAVERRNRVAGDDVDRRLSKVIRALREVAMWQEIGDSSA